MPAPPSTKPALSAVIFSAVKFGNWLADHGLEQAQRHVEVMDEQSDRRLLVGRKIEVEPSAGRIHVGRHPDECPGVADADRGHVDLDVVDGGQAVPIWMFARLCRRVEDGRDPGRRSSDQLGELDR